MSLRRRHSIPKGFTLIEVLLAAVVMLAGIVGMMQAVTSGSEMLDVSRKQTTATQIIHGEIEKIRVSDWTPPDPARPLPWTDTIDVNTAGFHCTRTISNVKPDLNQVTYTVTWVGNTGHSYSRSSSTYVGRNGLYVAYQR